MVFTSTEHKILRSFGEAMIPKGGPFALGVKDIDMASSVEKLFLGMDPFILKGLKWLLKFFELSPILFIFKLNTFTKMSEQDRESYLIRLENSSLYICRAMFLALKTISVIVFYSDERIEEIITRGEMK